MANLYSPHTVTLRVNDVGHGEVMLDGRPINVTAISIHARHNEPTKVVLEMIAAVDVVGTAHQKS